MLSLITARAILGVYALLLAVGGLIGYLKAGSRPSLIAGIASAALALLALYLTTINAPVGLIIGALVALFLAGFFGYRFLARTRKFMPAGLLSIVSVVVMIAALLSL